MILRLEIENFYSIRETQVIDLRIGAKVPDEGGRFGSLRDGSGLRIPQTVASLEQMLQGNRMFSRHWRFWRGLSQTALNLNLMPRCPFGDLQTAITTP